MNRSLKYIVLSALLLTALTGCSIYKLDIRQGNYVTADMREKLKLGMTKDQVQFVLGEPLITDIFHADRWDYYYSFAHQGKIETRQSMTLYFTGDKLTRIDDAKMPPLPVVAEEPVPPLPVSAESAVPPASAVDIAPETAAVSAVAEVKPAVSPDQAAVEASVQAWASAWSDGDVTKYLSAYIPDYNPVGMSHVAWRKQRTLNIKKSSDISVKLSDMKVTVKDASHATVTFRQDYFSDIYHDSLHKTLQLEKTGDSWLIDSEQADQ